MKAIAERANKPENKAARKHATEERRRSHAHPQRGNVLILHRKCACGGGCPRCQEHVGKDNLSSQTKLKISQPGDPLEREADRVADAVMRMPDPAGARADVDLAGTDSQRNADSSSAGANALPMVQEALRTSGRPLDPIASRFMETRLGYDFGRVRVHVGEPAIRAARAVNAQAFTVGWDIVFAAGEYQPHTHAGRGLIAHELTHAVQQETSGERWIGRRGPIPRPPVQTPVRVPTGRRVAAPPRSLPELAEALKGENRRREALGQALRTRVVLTRGGSPPDFISEHEELGVWEWGTERYTVRNFHILDAIEHGVMRAENQGELVRVLQNFIPEVLPEDYQPRPTYILSGDPRLWGATFPHNFDPDGEKRLKVFWHAYELRNLQLQTEAKEETERRLATEAEAQVCLPSEPDLDLDMANGYCDEYGCQIEPIAQQSGRYPCHADYARSLSNVSREFRITTPDGTSVDFDAMDWGGALYEVKTGYRRVAFWTGIVAQRTEERFVDQSERQLEVAEKCHRSLDWYFNDEGAAAHFDSLIRAPVHYVPFDCDKDSDG